MGFVAAGAAVGGVGGGVLGGVVGGCVGGFVADNLAGVINDEGPNEDDAIGSCAAGAVSASLPA